MQRTQQLNIQHGDPMVFQKQMRINPNFAANNQQAYSQGKNKTQVIELKATQITPSNANQGTSVGSATANSRTQQLQTV